MLTILQVVGALVLLVIASEAFTNAVEWVGELYGLARSAVGAVVAAVGSSLPETMVAAVALVLLHDPDSQAVGIGAVLGAPLLLGTIAFATIGLLALFRQRGDRSMRLDVDGNVAIFGLTLFVLTFAVVIGASFASTHAVRVGASAIVIGAYLAYLAYHMRRTEPESDELPPPLRLWRAPSRPPKWVVFAQLAIAVGLSLAGSRWFVGSVTAASSALHVSPLLLSLLISPIATELPELTNVWIWMRRCEDELAFGNVVGAMLFQTSVASTIAMLASPWHLSGPAYAACGAAMLGAATVLVLTVLRRRVEPLVLALCALFYAGYLIATTLIR